MVDSILALRNVSMLAICGPRRRQNETTCREKRAVFDLLAHRETTDLEQRLAFSPRPDDLGDYLINASLALTTRVCNFLGVKTQRELLMAFSP